MLAWGPKTKEGPQDKGAQKIYHSLSTSMTLYINLLQIFPEEKKNFTLAYIFFSSNIVLLKKKSSVMNEAVDGLVLKKKSIQYFVILRVHWWQHTHTEDVASPQVKPSEGRW